MHLNLEKKPLGSPKIIVGFPGFGLVGTIATKFLLEHLEVEHIGCIESDRLLPLAAIHKTKLIGPLDFFYNKKYNLVIVQTLSEITGFEWKISEMIQDLAEGVKAKEVIILEGIPTTKKKKDYEIYYYSENKNFEKLGIKPIQEGVMMGATATLLLRCKSVPISALLAEGHSNMPDSEAAARVIKVLDQYIGMQLDYKPLLEAAKKFESMLKGLMSKM
ncbi:MAG: PAC2 family protein, partial [Nanoarchaeota archaeon]|nr:PAC2 family protein [Nanoarchaeota archaeon]